MDIALERGKGVDFENSIEIYQPLQKVDLSSAQFYYLDITLENRVIEANQTIHYHFPLVIGLGDPIGAWVGQVLSGSSFAEMTFSIIGLVKTGFDLHIHNTTEATYNYRGAGHGERMLNNVNLRIFILYL